MNKQQFERVRNAFIKTGACLNQIEHDRERKYSAVRKIIQEVFEACISQEEEYVVDIVSEHIEIGNNYFGVFVYSKYSKFRFQGKLYFIPYEDKYQDVGLKFVNLKEIKGE
jgi:hypothetical protein